MRSTVPSAHFRGCRRFNTPDASESTLVGTLLQLINLLLSPCMGLITIYS